MKKIVLEKLQESLRAVFPIGLIILLLHFTLVPMPVGTLVLMVFGLTMLIVGLMLFSLGTDMAMMPMGERIGSVLLQSKNLTLLLSGCLVFGFIVTVAEPDLQVMTKQVPSIPDLTLLGSVALGVGIFLVVAVLRLLFRKSLSHMLIVLYILTFIIALFSADYLAVAFDASAVTTGPITVPFLLALGSGFAAVSSGKGSEEDNFGICSICSVGPILAVLITGLFFDSQSTGYEMETPATVANLAEFLTLFGVGLVHSFGEVAMPLIPIAGIFAIFQFTHLKLSKTELVKIGIGLLYLLAGLTIFLTGVNKGFMPAGKYLGESMGRLEYNWILAPICLVVGACVVIAEPAVHVLTKQVEEITNGAIARSTLLCAMALGVGLAMSLAMVRMLAGLPIWWIVVPGYILALSLTFFIPSFFVGIGFDSGGVAAGAMSAAFVLPFTIGACEALGGNIMIEAFGVVGMISMMPPITLELLGVVYNIKLKKALKLQKTLEPEQEKSEREKREALPASAGLSPDSDESKFEADGKEKRNDG
ncbi:MAG: DUF1538 domain-containing protein [Synergistaceae bacterium]|jgi:hypothetical protein|nr:DUF1538 domain-containing protein [Synergistaceae bacterium]